MKKNPAAVALGRKGGKVRSAMDRRSCLPDFLHCGNGAGGGGGTEDPAEDVSAAREHPARKEMHGA
jgi:hypothetical protein